jgi:hypothetical protein
MFGEGKHEDTVIQGEKLPMPQGATV